MTSARVKTLLGVCSFALMLPSLADAASHREAPFITELPKVDGTDFYLFRSYEDGKADTVTLLANYQPLQDPYGGPNYFTLDDQALYEIHVDNNGDAKEDLTFQFRFKNQQKGLAVPAGGAKVEVPLVNIGAIGPKANDTQNLNVLESYELSVIQGDRRRGKARAVVDAETGKKTFAKPADNIGTRSVPDYETYARNHIRPITIPGCKAPGRVFVGQRKEGFAVNLGQTFDLLNYSKRQELGGGAFTPIGEENNDVGPNSTDDKNITTLALEVPIGCLTNGKEAVIGAWTTASVKRDRVKDKIKTGKDRFAQVSRLGSPLVNEVVIGLRSKDQFNSSEPKDDAQFAGFVTNPTLPELIEIVFQGAVTAPDLFPRTDLVAAFLTGVEVPGAVSNKPAKVRPAEMLRLNTATPATPTDQQSRLGVIGGDVAGFPNGRRPGDDVVDIELRVAMGRLISLGLFGKPENAASGNLDFTDGALVTSADFDASFPYLRAPLPGNLTE
jgi:hypothetical protein